MERLEPNALHFYMSRIIFKRKKKRRNEANTIFSSREKRSLCLDKKENSNSLLGEQERVARWAVKKTNKQTNRQA